MRRDIDDGMWDKWRNIEEVNLMILFHFIDVCNAIFIYPMKLEVVAQRNEDFPMGVFVVPSKLHGGNINQNLMEIDEIRRQRKIV